jgi:hypothetical protein
MSMLTTDEFFALVQQRLYDKQPFSFVRISDGEIMLLNRHEYYQAYRHAVTKLWGYTPAESELVEITKYLIESLRKCDVVGFPTPRHLARTDYFRDGEGVFRDHIGSLKRRTTVSIDVPYEMLATSLLHNSQALYPDYFEELLRDRHSLIYISCWDLDKKLKKKYGIRNINSFQITGEPKFSSEFEGQRQYPTQFLQIREWIKEQDCRGVLCLVGGGVFSKIYNTWFAERGGVALDVGSVFDAWKGRATRGKQRGLDVIDNTYRL